MILKTLRIENYKCIEDSGEFTIEPVTCLVGKNESGKSSLLEALYKLNPVDLSQDKFDIEEYPRRFLSEFEEGLLVDRSNVLNTQWELTDKEVEQIEQVLGRGSLLSPTIVILKGYDNEYILKIEINQQSVINYYLEQCGIEEMPVDGNFEDVKALINHLEQIQGRNDEQDKLFQMLIKIFPDRSVSEVANKLLIEYIPKILYFSQYQTLPGQVQYEQFIQKRSQNQLNTQEKTFVALLYLAGVTPETFSSATKAERLIAKLESTSNRISKQIFEYWSQNKDLSVQIRFDVGRPNDPPPFNTGNILRTRIYNKRHEVSVNFDERSSGFIWFFSFLAWFSHIQNVYGDNLLLLLDEPGLNLHAKAQSDLLRFIKEKLLPKYQVIYTTHSPFMIDAENILSVRTVEDLSSIEGEVLGTKVGDHVLATDSDTIFPLQAALGYDITQTLFVGKNTLLVEGPSDLLYIRWFTTQLKKRNREGLDPRWTVAPAGGVDKISSFVALFGGNKLHVAVLTDYAEGDKKKIRSLRESELLRQGHVFSAEMYAGQSEADVEDLIGINFYSSLINHCYKLEGGCEFNAAKSECKSMRIVKKVEEYFGTLPPEVPEFDHFQPSVYLVEHPEIEWPDLEITLERFEKFFKDVNKLLE
ncbi:AAA family ATPase [Desulfosporosinus sp. FKB]|uniref:ATP-dependent nuclease n=1 Tax=Desulfosporosinus sp. FKB TaxID=1969835 RepID=UPI00148388C7|nr:AAA family ATPase [Desulfosporosinus sp. FKB]